ncbi:MAG: polymerase, partial [Chloroflexaceae bacterium]|nr:polymerase [Chloroflexaceae bacterium]
MLPRRPVPRLLLLLAVSLALLIALVALVWFDNEANRGVVATPPTAPIPHGDGPQLGVNLFNLHVEPDRNVITRTLQLASEMGARYARMQIPWDDIEIHGRGDWSDRRNDLNGDGTPDTISAWEKYDLIVETANRFNIQLIMRLERAPLWARPELANTQAWRDGLAIDGNSTGPPDDFADYGNFVRTIVSRYRGQVRYFQIWNEPNLKNEWNWQTPGPQDFVGLLRVGYTAAKEANPDAVVLFPSLAATDGLDYRAPMSELEYLDQVYQAGGAAYFDVMAAQAYGLGQPPDENRYVFLRGRGNWAWNRPLDTRIDVSRMVLLREVMERNGDGDTPVWVGEFGWNAAPDSIPPERRFTWGEPVSEAQKGEYIVGMVERARREWPWVGVMNVWMLRYGGYREPAPDDPTQYFALVGRDWQLLPAYERLREWSQQPAVAGVGTHNWQHPAVEAIPDGWRVRFTGTQLTVVGGLDSGIRPTLDGQPISLTRDGINGMQALSTDSLADGLHTLEVVAPGAAAPAYFLVERARPWGWLWALLPALLLAALAVSMVATLRSAFTVADSVFSGENLITRNGGLVVGLAMGLSLLLFYRATPTVPLTVLGLLLFGGLALLRPDVGLLFVPLTWPLYFMPKGIWDAAFGIGGEGMRFPMHELVLLLVLAATITRWILRKNQEPRTKNPLSANFKHSFISMMFGSRFWILGSAPVLLFLLAATIGLLVVPPEGRGAA